MATAPLLTRSAEADALRRLVLVPVDRKSADGPLRRYRLARARVEAKQVRVSRSA